MFLIFFVTLHLKNQIIWTVACGELFNGTDAGEFSSPGYPGIYSSNLRCDYTIMADPEDFVTLSFMEPFEMEDREDFFSVFVTIF